MNMSFGENFLSFLLAFSWCPAKVSASTSTAGAALHRSAPGLLHQARLLAKGSPSTAGTSADPTAAQGAGGG